MISIKRYSVFIITVFAIVLFFSVSFIRNFDNNELTEENFQNLIEQQQVETVVQNGQVDEVKETTIMVDIKGAVNKPGVYEMKQGDRIISVIEKAQGFHKDANIEVINLALLLEDEMLIYVPKVGEEQVHQVSTTTVVSNDNGKININTASIEELQEIPGIGPAKARTIISYREENGKFKNPDELVQVSGIGQKTVEKMLDYIVAK